jgi:hypothetical protein
MFEQLLIPDEVAGNVHISPSNLELLSAVFATCLSKFANPPKDPSGHDSKRLYTLQDVAILARAQALQDRAVPGFQGDQLGTL